MSINWYPGHMHKATKEIKEILPKVDLVIEVLDARIPYSSENPVIAELTTDKPRIKLLNKSDLADPVLTKAWLAYFEREQNIKALAVSSQSPERIKDLINLVHALIPASIAQVRNIDAMIMGIPNVGKSTILNTLSGKQTAKTGNEPAVTKGQQRIDCRNGLILFDTPGILWPKIYNEQSAYRLAATGAIKNTAMSYDDVAFFTCEYLLKTYPEFLKARYKLDSLPKEEMEFFNIIGKQRGCLGKGGVVDLNQISKLFLTEFREATIGRITMETPEIVDQEKIIVAELKAQREAKIEEKKQRKAKRFKKK